MQVVSRIHGCSVRWIGKTLFATLTLLAAAWGSVFAQDPIDFARDIEPIFIRHCSECHGPDQQKSGLRLDARDSALGEARSGMHPIVPGDPNASELLRRVLSQDPDEVMPPKGRPLEATDIDRLRRWIAEGAKWNEADPLQHWAFQVPVRPEVPKVEESGVDIHNAIDHFIVARLQKAGLGQQPEADRPTLIRRLSLDLTGLPPSPAEVSAFLSDDSPHAYEHLVDRLLASPHFGEHMGRLWLDLARYADSNGYQVDLARSIWPYREWVIRAFNENQPFDQFTIEQIAGDLLPNPTLEQRIATGFNRNTKINDEGGGDAEEYRTKAVKDRVATLGTTWLGLTLNCAECHTHKYDPITHAEYYQLYAFFNNTTDGGNYSLNPTIEVPRPDLADTMAYLRGQLAQAKSSLDSIKDSLQGERSQWEKTVRDGGDPWTLLKPTRIHSTGGSSYTNLADGSILGHGVNPIYDTIYVDTITDLKGVTSVLLEVLPDPSLPKNGPGRWGQTGNFILDELTLSAGPASDPSEPTDRVEISGAVASWEQLYYSAEHAVDGHAKTGWAIGPRFGEPHFLIVTLKEPLPAYPDGTRLSFRFEHYHGSSHTIGRFRLSATTETNPTRLWPLTAEVRETLATAPTDRTPEQLQVIHNAQLGTSLPARNLDHEIFRLEQRIARLEGQKFTTPVMQDRTDPEPRPTHIHLRGDFLSKGPQVTPGVPAMLHPLPQDAPPNRLALARWLVDPANPLVARVTVNRYWQGLFGTGLVATSEDFGRQGEAPSHPDLLDWLATEFVESGWDTKSILKLIVMSASYRQDSAMDANRLEKDFYNRLLSRGPRFRMDGEMIRDHALAVSGLLNPKLGGPSVHPVQVANLWKEIGFLRPEIGMDEWPLSDGPELYRRAVYTFWRRVCTYPTFAAFDAPSREVCVARRPRTNTPLQALAALNEPTLLEAARVFAQRILTEGGSTDATRIEFALRACVGRSPTEAERQRLMDYVRQQRREFAEDKTSATHLISIGTAPRTVSVDDRELAVWMVLANVLFNLDETLTKG